MKKAFVFVLIILLGLAVVTSSCKLPAPGGTPPTAVSQADTDEQQAAQATAAQATALAQQAEEQKPATAPPTETQAPAASTATTAPTSIPATATAVPTQVVTVAPPTQVQRIQFLPGAESGTVAGSLNSGASASYVLGVSAGQTMNVQVWSPNNDVYLAVLASDGVVLLDGSSRLAQWVGVVNATGDYYLTVSAAGGQTSYSITVVIPALPQPVVPTATFAPTSTGPAFDPYETYGTPDFEDMMDTNSIIDWANPDGTLPDTPDIRFNVDEDKFLVSGKNMDYSTWWFNWASLKDFYIELTVDTRTCSGGDAYGLILRGPAHGAGMSYGYVVSFTCDGSLWVYRLDGVKPWISVDLVGPAASPYINRDSNATNVIGVKAVGGTMTIYANGYQVTQFVDSHYLEGRYGLFVYPDVTNFYTYEAAKIAYWIFDD